MQKYLNLIKFQDCNQLTNFHVIMEKAILRIINELLEISNTDYELSFLVLVSETRKGKNKVNLR